jgi:hypothetical protein
MSGNSGSQGAWSGFDRPRYSRDNFDRGGHEQALTDLRDAAVSADTRAPTANLELDELERLIRKYQDKAREILARLNGS